MTAADRDLVLALRSELAAIDPARPCDRRSEAIALGGVTVARDAPLARLLLRLARERADERQPDLAERAGRGARRLDPFDWAAALEHCRLAWLRGLFLARGSLSLAGGRTHLEFVLAPDDAPVLASRLADVGLPASWRIRRGRGVVTWKNGERVGLFLRRIGAAAALLELEARQVSRALRGDLNRVLNAESANLQRAVGAAGRQVAAIEELAATGELAVQPYVVRSVAEARLETPEATLSELADRLSIHRSAVQRALERIERLSLVAADRPTRTRRTAATAPPISAGRAPLA
jgi:DNA-binding protein WhiA